MERLSPARWRANCGRSRSPTGTRCKKMVSGLVLLRPCSCFLFFLGFSSPLATSGGSSLTPHPGFTQQRPPDLRICLFSLLPTSISCARCPLPALPVPVGKIWEPWQGQKWGGSTITPMQELSASFLSRKLLSPHPQPLRVPIPAGEGTLALSPPSASLGLCWASREVLGHAGVPGRKEKARTGGQGGGEKKPTTQQQPTDKTTTTKK